MRHALHPPLLIRPLPALALLAVLGLASAAPGLDLDFVTVGDPGNAADTDVMRCCEELSGTTGYGSVPYLYRIGKFEVTAAQYAEFLNAVAAESDPNALWDQNMGDPGAKTVLRSLGPSGDFVYEAGAGEARNPINHIQFFDAARFANWLHNGQPVGPQGPATTEDGAYTLTGVESPPDVERNEGARFAIPSQDEWYKAAFYDPELGYFDFATGEDLAPDAVPPPGGEVPAANYCPEDPDVPVGDCPPDPMGPNRRTEVGAYVDSPSPWGTFDQAGNHLEWNEALVFDEAAEQFERGFRGGWYKRGLGDLNADNADHLDPGLGEPDRSGLGGMGFRVVALPEPGAAAGALAALGALGALARRRP